MFRVKCVLGLGRDPVVVAGVHQLIVEDIFDNPIAVIVAIDERTATVIAANDPDFNRVLTGLGIDKLVIDSPLTLERRPTDDGAVLLNNFTESR